MNHFFIKITKDLACLILKLMNYTFIRERGNQFRVAKQLVKRNRDVVGANL